MEGDAERIFNISYREPLVWTKRTPVPEVPKLTCVPLKEAFPVSCLARREGKQEVLLGQRMKPSLLYSLQKTFGHSPVILFLSPWPCHAENLTVNQLVQFLLFKFSSLPIKQTSSYQ